MMKSVARTVVATMTLAIVGLAGASAARAADNQQMEVKAKGNLGTYPMLAISGSGPKSSLSRNDRFRRAVFPG